jgi:pimeloyl-ACP methyl ester carboxylesterase
MQSPYTIPEGNIRPLEREGLHGRILELPPLKQTEKTKVLLIYGLHSSLERMYTISQVMTKYGAVTVPDLPGFGGMTSLDCIGEKPTIDNIADFLATFVEDYYTEDEQIIMAGMSYGFVVLTRMLQRHPHLQSRVKLLLSIVGFTNKKDFAFKSSTYYLFTYGSRFFSYRPTATFFRRVILLRPIIFSTYNLRAHTHPKMKGFSYKERRRLIDFEVALWQNNDSHTYFTSTYEILTLNLSKRKLDVPVHHVAVANDQYFNNSIVKKHLGQIFSKVTMHYAHLANHAPTIIDDAESASQLIPESLIETLKKA